MLALVLSTESGYYPLDQETSISSKGQQSKGVLTLITSPPLKI